MAKTLFPSLTDKNTTMIVKWMLAYSCLWLMLLPNLTVVQAANTLEKDTVGELQLQHKNGTVQSALLLNTAIGGEVNGLIANINVKQTFKNTSTDWLNGQYLFPLPEGAAVDSLTLTIGKRIIVGEIKEKAAAKKAYESAKKQGKKAGLLEQHRPNLFTLSVANIPPQSTVIADITFVDKVHYDNQQFSLRLPTTLTPRYIPGNPIKLAIKEDANVTVNATTGWASNSDIVADAASITPPQTHRVTDKTSQLFSLGLALNAGIELASINSLSHTINTQFKTSNKQQVHITLEQGQELMDRDLILTWKPAPNAVPSAAIFNQFFADKHYIMLMFMPPSANVVNALPREIIFIVDSSGSMAGNSMQQARQSLYKAIDLLSPNDYFNIVDFDNHFQALFSESQKVNNDSISQAKRMIHKLSADGGTEMYPALNFALSQAPISGTLKQVVFITDGSIGNEQQLFKLINDKLGDSRLFTIGIGSAPNAYFMNNAASFGRGSFTYINNTHDVSEQMTGLFKKLSHPILRDIKIEWPEAAGAVEHYPTRIPDLYSGEPLLVFAQSDQAINDITINGSLLNNRWQRKLSITSGESQSKNIDTLWARHKVESLMNKLVASQNNDSSIKTEITKLGIVHQIATRFTSFVAIEQTPSKATHEKADTVKIANAMPKGSTMSIPQTATPAKLYALLGLLLLALSLLLRNPNFISHTKALHSKVFT